MTTLKVYSSPADNGRRSEFTEFYEAAYSTIVGELLALTGSLDHARAVGAGSFSRAWQAWPSIRVLAEPEMWVRQDAMTRAYAPPRGMRLLQRGLPPIEPVDLDPEDDVLVAALQRLPMEQRLPLVLHYLAGVPVELIAEWAHCTADQMEALLDDGFDALVAVLDWPVDAAAEQHVEGEEYDWTAEALQESAQRLPQHITTPPPTISFRHAKAVKLSKRGAPVGAAAAACLGLLLTLSAPSQPAARPAAFSDDAPEVKQPLGPTLAVVSAEHVRDRGQHATHRRPDRGSETTTAAGPGGPRGRRHVVGRASRCGAGPRRGGEQPDFDGHDPAAAPAGPCDGRSRRAGVVEPVDHTHVDHLTSSHTHVGHTHVGHTHVDHTHVEPHRRREHHRDEHHRDDPAPARRPGRGRSSPRRPPRKTRRRVTRQ